MEISLAFSVERQMTCHWNLSGCCLGHGVESEMTCHVLLFEQLRDTLTWQTCCHDLLDKSSSRRRRVQRNSL